MGDSYRLTIAAIAAILIWTVAGGTAISAGEKTAHEPTVVVDDKGRRITVTRPFTRIISLYGAHTENLFELGLEEEIIGVSRHEVFPPAAMSKPVYSYHEDAEKFLAARPDLVLIRPMIDRGYPQLIDHLERNRITVVSLQPGSIEEMFRYWLKLGRLVGRQKEAQRMVDRFKNKADEYRRLTAGISPLKKVYFEAIHDKMKTFTPDAMAVFALETAGGKNVAADARQVRQTNIAHYGKERILAKAAEIDVYLAQYGAMNRPTTTMIKNEPGFQLIEAVRKDQVYIIDEHIVSRPTMRLLDGVIEIGRILYPDQFGSITPTDWHTVQ